MSFLVECPKPWTNPPIKADVTGVSRKTEKYSIQRGVQIKREQQTKDTQDKRKTHQGVNWPSISQTVRDQEHQIVCKAQKAFNSNQAIYPQNILSGK